MTQRIVIVQGHPDRHGGHLCHALAQHVAQGATSAGHELRSIDVATLEFPLLRSRREWGSGHLPAGLVEAQQAIGWATHLVLFFPLWLGDMPALLYRWYFRAHSVKSLERNILGFADIAPIDETLVGMVDGLDEAQRRKWFEKVHGLGVKAK